MRKRSPEHAATLATVAAALAANATGAVPRALNLPGISGSYASTPDTPANSVPGSIDIRVRAALADWTQASLVSSGDLVSKDSTANRDYFLEIDSTGHLLFQYTPMAARSRADRRSARSRSISRMAAPIGSGLRTTARPER